MFGIYEVFFCFVKRINVKIAFRTIIIANMAVHNYFRMPETGHSVHAVVNNTGSNL